MQTAEISDGDFILIDTETVQRWLADNDVQVTLEQADRIIDYMYQSILDRAYDLVLDGHYDLYGSKE